MKMLRTIVIIFTTTILYFSSFSISGASEYLGEFCWYEAASDSTLKLAITHMGGSHYLVHGRITEASGTVLPVNGNAETVGDEVIMHFSSSGSSTNDFWTSQDRMIIDLQTLDILSIESIFTNLSPKPDGEISHRYEYMDTIIPRVPCN